MLLPSLQAAAEAAVDAETALLEAKAAHEAELTSLKSQHAAAAAAWDTERTALQERALDAELAAAEQLETLDVTRASLAAAQAQLATLAAASAGGGTLATPQKAGRPDLGPGFSPGLMASPAPAAGAEGGIPNPAAAAAAIQVGPTPLQ
jgi:hypothetical protein